VLDILCDLFAIAKFLFLLYLIINVKKLQFIHKLMPSDTSKTAKVTKT